MLTIVSTLHFSVNSSERLMGLFYALVDIPCERKTDK